MKFTNHNILIYDLVFISFFFFRKFVSLFELLLTSKKGADNEPEKVNGLKFADVDAAIFATQLAYFEEQFWFDLTPTNIFAYLLGNYDIFYFFFKN